VTERAAGARVSPPRRRSRMWRGQSAVEFALIAVIALIIMLLGVQYALIGQAALAVSQGSSALARYAAVNRGTVTPNGTVTLTDAMKQLLSPTILTNNGGDLTVTAASYQGTTTTTTNSPQYTDRLVLSISYNATSKIVLPNPFFGLVAFPTTLGAADSQMYE
jgi:Flp pilus assembly protein TadG